MVGGNQWMYYCGEHMPWRWGRTSSHIQYASFDGINLYRDFIDFIEQYNIYTNEFTIKSNYLINNKDCNGL